VAKESLGGPLIVASLMLALSILGAGYFMSKSIDRTNEQLKELAVAVNDIPAAAPAAPTRQAARPGRPDPKRRYTIAVAGAPTKGPKDAKVTIVEWSDFQ